MAQKNTKSNTKHKSSFFKLHEDFIPYTNHISEDTVLTKNLQILKTIRVSEFFGKKDAHNPNQTLRENIRSAIKKSIDSADFAIWIHTIRRKADLHEFSLSKEQNSALISQKWNEFYKFETQYINEVYITIIAKGPVIQDKDVARKYFTNAKLKNFVFTELEDVQGKLTKTVQNLTEELKTYNPYILQIREKNGVMYSENIDFLNRILNLSDSTFEMEEIDISNILSTAKINLLQNKINITNQDSNKSIATFTLKHYLDADLVTLEKILTLPFEFIIYQAFNFTNIDDVIAKYYQQYQMLKISKDYKMMKQLNLTDEEFKDIETKKGQVTLDYGESQISIIITADNEEELDIHINKMVSILQETGFVFVRDDVMIEDSFFSSLPANFLFLKKLQPLQASQIAGFTAIDSYSSGRSASAWGGPVCTFKSYYGSYYFFNFHNNMGEGHTLFIGKESDIFQNVIINFLLLNSIKLGVRVLNIDIDHSTKLINAFVGGKHKILSIDKNENTASFNPMKLLSNIESFTSFCKISLMQNGKATEANLKYLQNKIIPFFKNQIKSIKTFNDFVQIIKNDKLVSVFFSQIQKDGIMHHIFNNTNDDILNLKQGEFCSIDISELIKSNGDVSFILEYLILSIACMAQDNQKTIVKIDYFLSFCINAKITKNKIINFLSKLKQHNAVLICLESYSLFEDKDFNKADKEFLKLISNYIYTPAFVDYGEQEEPTSSSYLDHIAQTLPLTEKCKNTIKNFAYNQSVFIVQQEGKSMPLRFDSEFSEFYYFLLASSPIDDFRIEGLIKSANFEERQQQAELLYQSLLNQYVKQK